MVSIKTATSYAVHGRSGNVWPPKVQKSVVVPTITSTGRPSWNTYPDVHVIACFRLLSTFLISRLPHHWRVTRRESQDHVCVEVNWDAFSFNHYPDKAITTAHNADIVVCNGHLNQYYEPYNLTPTLCNKVPYNRIKFPEYWGVKIWKIE